METLQDLAEKIQQECHATVEFLLKHNEKLNHQDATNVFLYKKLAEIQFTLNQVIEKIDKLK